MENDANIRFSAINIKRRWLVSFSFETLKYAIHLMPNTAWKVFKHLVFAGPYFPVFVQNMKIYVVNLCIESEYRKIRSRYIFFSKLTQILARFGEGGKSSLFKGSCQTSMTERFCKKIVKDKESRYLFSQKQPSINIWRCPKYVSTNWVNFRSESNKQQPFSSMLITCFFAFIL